MPNPDCEYLSRGIELARDNKVDYLLAAGGGSVIDGAKFIAAGFYFEGDAWQLIADQLPIIKGLSL